jgi:hypothetical protein
MLRKLVNIGIILTMLAASLVLVGGSVSAGTCIEVRVVLITTRQTTVGGKLIAEYSVDGDVIGTVDFGDMTSLGIVPASITRLIGTFRVLLDGDADTFEVSLNRPNIVGGGHFSAETELCGGAELQDGRLNFSDAAALAVIYPTESEGYLIYTIDPVTSRGEPVLRVTRRQVNAALDDATAPGGAHTLIGSYNDITLWALNSGECQMNSLYADGSLSEFIFRCAV